MLIWIIYMLGIINILYCSNSTSNTKKVTEPAKPKSPRSVIRFPHLINFCKFWKKEQPIPLTGENSNDNELLNQILQKIFDVKNKIVQESITLSLANSNSQLQIMYNRDLDSIRFVLTTNKTPLPSIIYITKLLQTTKPRLKNIYILFSNQLQLTDVNTIKSSLFSNESNIGHVHGYSPISGFDKYLSQLMNNLCLEPSEYFHRFKGLSKNSPYLCYIGSIKSVSENIHVIYPGNLGSIPLISDKYIGNIDFYLNFTNQSEFFQYIIQQTFGLPDGTKPNEFNEGSNVWIRINNTSLSIENLRQLMSKMRYGIVDYMGGDINQIHNSVFTELRRNGQICLSSSSNIDQVTKKNCMNVKFIYPKQQNNNEYVTIKCNTSNTLDTILMFLNTGNYFDLTDEDRLEFIRNYDKPNLGIDNLKDWLTLEIGSTVYESESGILIPLRKRLLVEYGFDKNMLGQVMADIAKKINELFTEIQCSIIRNDQALNLSIIGNIKGNTYCTFILKSQACKRICIDSIRNFVPDSNVYKMLGNEFIELDPYCKDRSEFIVTGWNANSNTVSLIDPKGAKHTVPLNMPYYTPLEMLDRLLTKQPGKRIILHIGTNSDLLKSDQSHFSPEWSSIFTEQMDFNVLREYEITQMLERYKSILPVPANDLYLQNKYKEQFDYLNMLASEVFKLVKTGSIFTFQFNALAIKLPNNIAEIVICAKDECYFEWLYFIKSLAQKITSKKNMLFKPNNEYDMWFKKLIKLNENSQTVLKKMQTSIYNEYWDRQYCRLKSGLPQDATKFWYKEDGNALNLAEGDNPGTGYIPLSQDEALILSGITGTNRFAREIIDFIL